MGTNASDVPTSLRGDRCAGLRAGRRSGFTITELLVVIFIIVLIIAITVPALSSARASAKKTETAQLLSTLSAGVSQFILDENRQPGYFTVKNMGHSENQTEGLSGMQNIMLEMLGGIVPDNTPAVPNVILDVGPRTAGKIKVDRNKINLAQPGGGKLYWASLAAKVFERSDENGLPFDTGNERRLGATAGTNDNTKIREIVDAFGAPVLAWAADDTIRTPITQVEDFATESSDMTTARAYWNSNAAFLSTGVVVGIQGKAQDEAGLPINEIVSLLGQRRTAIDRGRTLTGLLGNTGSPKNPGEPVITDILPTSAVGSVTFHSAGRDGIYLSRNNAGAKGATPSANGPILDYGLVLREKLIEKFDDVVQPSN